jgi:metal-sulfur cluster biosynthetic enzyme
MPTVPAALDRAAVARALAMIRDPEIGLDIVALGLIYAIDIAGGDLCVRMTMTARGCLLHAVIADAARDALCWLDGVERATVEVVWQPPWQPAMIDAAALARGGEARRGVPHRAP